MFVKAKQSGELLNKQSDERSNRFKHEESPLWTPEGVITSAEKIQRAYTHRDSLNMEGLLVVSGAGNVIRGEKLKRQGLAGEYRDVLGRLAIIQNTLVLSASLDDVKVPHKILISDNMGFKDPTIGEMEPYDVEAELEAYDHERVVLIAGGTGVDGRTTDNAVLEYASRHAVHAPKDQVMVLKGTKFNGVYDGDPRQNAEARRYASIPAQVMLDDYERYSAVDEESLHTIIKTGLSMRVYADSDYDLIAAISGNGDGIGTVITPTGDKPIFANL